MESDLRPDGIESFLEITPRGRLDGTDRRRRSAPIQDAGQNDGASIPGIRLRGPKTNGPRMGAEVYDRVSVRLERISKPQSGDLVVDEATSPSRLTVQNGTRSLVHYAEK